MLNPISIKATSLSDAWFQAVYALIKQGRVFTIDEGSFAGQQRLELDHVTIQITHPDALPMLPQLNPALGIPDPVDPSYINDYLPYLMTGEEKEGESYTYGQRICSAPAKQALYYWDTYPEIYKQDSEIWASLYGGSILNQAKGIPTLNQMELLIWTYKNKGHRNNQMTMQIAEPTDMLLVDPPCLRLLSTRIQDGALHFYPFFRSWDLWGGFPANLAAIEMMKQYCAAEIGVENGEIVASSPALHIYDYAIELAEAIRGRTRLELSTEEEEHA